jgi:hypothetical protein
MKRTPQHRIVVRVLHDDTDWFAGSQLNDTERSGLEVYFCKVGYLFSVNQ